MLLIRSSPAHSTPAPVKPTSPRAGPRVTRGHHGAGGPRQRGDGGDLRRGPRQQLRVGLEPFGPALMRGAWGGTGGKGEVKCEVKWHDVREGSELTPTSF